MILVNQKLVKVLSLGFANAITLWPFILLQNKELAEDKTLLIHEQIHLKQQLEMLIIGFYLLYLIEYLMYRIKGNNHLESYLKISFEQEAYQHEHLDEYLTNRRSYFFLHYLFK